MTTPDNALIELRKLAEDVKDWNSSDFWAEAVGEDDDDLGISVVGRIDEDGNEWPIAVIDADTYGHTGESLKMAKFYAAANPVAVLALLDRITELERSRDFYKHRCDELQVAQSTMRDPERTVVCDILANGHLLQDGAGKLDATRYGQLSQAQAVPTDVLAQKFHDAYERLAPSFFYQTREDTKVFDPISANGRLMIAVIAEMQTMLAAAPTPPVRKECWCETCDTATNNGLRTRMSLCPDCGNKRCPKANNHDNACTNSNAPGQPGSSWEHVKPHGIQGGGNAD